MFTHQVTAAPTLHNAYEALLFKFYEDRIDDDDLEQLQALSLELQEAGLPL